MGFERHGYHFEGAFSNPSYLDAKAGVYVIWCNNGSKWTVLDVGEGEDVRARILSHDRKDCWNRNCQGQIMYAVHYTPGLSGEQRRQIEGQLRMLERPPCGVQ